MDVVKRNASSTISKPARTPSYDTCSSLPFISAEKARELIDMFGAERFFFATDFPMWDAVGELERFNKIPMTDTERELILAGNIKRLLKL